MFLVKSLFAVVFLLSSLNLCIAQVKWKVNQILIGSSPLSGSMSFTSYLDYYNLVSKPTIGSGFIPDVEKYPVQRHMGGISETYKHFNIGISLNPVYLDNNQINDAQRIEMGLTYLPAMGRSIYYGKNEAIDPLPPVGTEINDISVTLTERLDQLQLFTRYQVRLTKVENPLRVYLGIDLRIGSEFENRVIRVAKDNLVIREYNADSSQIYVDYFTIRGEVPLRRSLYLTTLLPITFERNLNSYFTLYATAAFGWGYRIHNSGRGFNDPYSINFMEFGLKYNFRRSYSRL